MGYRCRLGRGVLAFPAPPLHPSRRMATFVIGDIHGCFDTLQALLGRTGLYDGGETGVFGQSTRSAVTAFQRSRFIEPDGHVGRLTRMVLYAAVGGYDRPTLAGGAS